jgi:NAD(P)-dependent dehydrogenase (short-subunit alcohol dehydrogenase family)
VLKHFASLFDPEKSSIFAALSARVGSISDNHLGGWYGYRASKAALNMLLKTASIEYHRTHKSLIIAGLHPGTVDSKLSKPFQANVPKEQLFTPEFAAQQLLQVLGNLTPEDSGNCFDWSGEKIEF